MTTITEASDAPAATATPYAMEAGDYFHGTLGFAGDADMIAVRLDAGTQYTVAMTGIGAGDASVLDTIVRVQTASGFAVAEDDDGGPGYYSSATFTPTVTGTYYIEAASYDGMFAGAYGVSVTEGDMPSFDAAMGAGTLARTGLSWTPTTGTGTTLTWGARATGPASDADGAPAPFQRFTADQIAAAEMALNEIASVSGLSFTRVTDPGSQYTDNATVLVAAYDSASDGAGAYAWFPSTARNRAASASDGDLWLNADSVGATGYEPGSYDYFTVLHELGHALGLSHPGDYNGGYPTYASMAQFVEDTAQYSVMSYFDESNTTGSYGQRPQTLMVYDILALQELYGANTATRAGDTTYGFNATEGGVWNFAENSDPALTIWDGGGEDTLDLSGFTDAQRIDLNDGAYSDIGGRTGNLGIAVGAVIENAVGGRGADVIIGNAADNTLDGGAGADTVAGGAGDDTILGSAGADTLAGGAGVDHLDYSGSAAGVRLDLDAGTATGGWATGDTLSDFEIVTGSATGDDMIAGTNGTDIIRTLGGDDRVIDRNGNDVIDLGEGDDEILIGNGRDVANGGAGFDHIDYRFSSAGVRVDLASNAVSGGWAADDTIANFEMVTGSATGNDVILGTNGSNIIRTLGGHDQVIDRNGNDVVDLGEGNDFILVGNGRDIVNGGEGLDHISYQYSDAGVRLDLGTNAVSGGWAADDTIANFEIATGSATGDDVIVGTNGANTIRTLGGDDVLSGAGGNDTLIAGAGDDLLNGGLGTDVLVGGAGADVFRFGRGGDTDTIVDFEDGIDTIVLIGFDALDAPGDIADFAVEANGYVSLDFGTLGTLQVANATVATLVDDVMLV